MSSNSFARSDSSPAEEPETDRATAHVGLVCTHAQELRTLVGRLDRRRRYVDNGMSFTGGFLDESIRVAVVEAGAGFAAHRQAATTLIAEHGPAWIISAGFSSSLSEEVPAGDLCLATAIHDTHGQQLLIKCPVPESKHGTLRPHLVTDQHPRTVAEKQQLAEAHDAAAVDTTSLAVAQVCTDTETGFLSIRAIIDDLNEELPQAAVERFFEPAAAGRQNPLSRWVSGIREPPEVKAWRTRMTTAAQRLDRFLTGVILQLGGSQR